MLNDVITEKNPRTKAGERAFARGAAYFESGAVTDLVVSDDTINAQVKGGDEYAVQLWTEGKRLGHSCTCPVGDGGISCKHGVAAGLAWLAGQKAVLPARRGKDGWLGSVSGCPPNRAGRLKNCSLNRCSTIPLCALSMRWPRRNGRKSPHAAPRMPRRGCTRRTTA